MNQTTIPDEDHVSRYCNFKSIDQSTEKPLASAFELKGHRYLSVNWLEYFGSEELADNVDCVRRVLENKLEIKESGRIVSLRVVEAKQVISDCGSSAPKIELLNDDENDPSHCGVFGYKDSDLLVATRLSRLVRESDIFPGKL